MIDLVAGIDPGIAGAIAILDRQGELVAHLEMPILVAGQRTRVNPAGLACFLKEFEGHCLRAWIERAGTRPGQGAVSLFSFGHAAGIAEGVIAALGIPLSLVTPQA